MVVKGRCSLSRTYDRIWFYLQTNLADRKKTEEAIALISRAAKAGYTGVLLGDVKFSLVERYDYDDSDEDYCGNAKDLVAECKACNLEIIPYLHTLSGSTPLLAYNPNLASGFLVKEATFETQNDVARFIPDPTVVVRNGCFTEHSGDMLVGWNLQDQSVFTTIGLNGRGFVLLNPTESDKNGLCRLGQRIKVISHRHYRISVWLKTEN